MSDADTHVQPPDRKSFRFWLWVIVILLCISSGGLRLWQTHQRILVPEQQRAQAATQYHQARAKAVSQVEALAKRSKTRQDSNGVPKPYTLAELQGELNNGQPFELPYEGERGTIRWTPNVGVGISLVFAEGQWLPDATRVLTPCNLSFIGMMLYSPLNRFDRFTARLVGVGASVGSFIWLVAFGTLFAWKRRRALLAELMLALALLSGTAWLTMPTYAYLGWPPRLVNAPTLMWSLPMLALSGLAIWWARRKLNIPSWPACTRCGYHLTGNVSGICPECGTPT